jgi:hypothetical protein
MKSIFIYSRLLAATLLSFALCGCASESELTAIRLDTSHPLYTSESCQQSLNAVRMHQDVKLVSSVATPVLVLLSGGLLLPLVGANAALDTADRIDASNLATRCGGKGKSADQIAEGVVQGAAFGLVTGLPGK